MKIKGLALILVIAALPAFVFPVVAEPVLQESSVGWSNHEHQIKFVFKHTDISKHGPRFNIRVYSKADYDIKCRGEGFMSNDMVEVKVSSADPDFVKEISVDQNPVKFEDIKPQNQVIKLSAIWTIASKPSHTIEVICTYEQASSSSLN